MSGCLLQQLNVHTKWLDDPMESQEDHLNGWRVATHLEMTLGDWVEFPDDPF